MATRRKLLWILFLGGAGVLALIPEFFAAPPEDMVRPVDRAGVAPTLHQQGQLAELRSPATAPAASVTGRGLR
jgi:hypothetical protein